MQGFTRPVGGSWLFGSTNTDYVEVNTSAKTATWGIPVQFGADGFTVYIKLGTASPQTDGSLTVYAHVAGDETSSANYSPITPDLIPNPTVLTGGWVSYSFTPPCTRYLGFEFFNRDTDKVRIHAVFAHGG